MKSKKYLAIWQYYDQAKSTSNIRADGWYDYDGDASDIVEDEWQRYVANRASCDVRSVQSGQFEYMVDFMQWKQKNIIHPSHTTRNIRRLDERGLVTCNPYSS